MEEKIDKIQIENQNGEKEIDLIALVKRLWQKRKFILWVTGAFMFIGLLVALFSPKVYTSSCLFVPQVNKKGVSGSMSSLAAMAGINLNDMGGASELSPRIYPEILKNIDFRKELMYSKFHFSEWKEPITLLDYYTNPEYNKPTFFSYIKKYTIGLPFLILNAIRGDSDNYIALKDEKKLKLYSEEEFSCSKVIGNILIIKVNDKEGYIQIIVNMPEPLVAAEVAQRSFDLLEKYITEFKIKKVKATLAFVDDRLAEMKSSFEEKQLAYARFKDANRALSSATARIQDEELSREYNLANTMYTELARQKVQVELQVKEDTPILSVVQPVAVPYKKSKPQRARILVLWIFLGGIVGCATVFGLDFLKNQELSWLGKWN